MMLKLKAKYNDAKNDLGIIGIYGDLYLIFKFLMGLDPFGCCTLADWNILSVSNLVTICRGVPRISAIIKGGF